MHGASGSSWWLPKHASSLPTAGFPPSSVVPGLLLLCFCSPSRQKLCYGASCGASSLPADLLGKARYREFGFKGFGPQTQIPFNHVRSPTSPLFVSDPERACPGLPIALFCLFLSVSRWGQARPDPAPSDLGDMHRRCKQVLTWPLPPTSARPELKPPLSICTSQGTSQLSSYILADPASRPTGNKGPLDLELGAPIAWW